jgi:hypothetical protein
VGGKLTSHLTAPFFLQTRLIEGIISTTTILWEIFAIALPISPTLEDCANHEMMTPTCPCFQASSISNRSIKYNLIGHCITYSIAHCIQAHSFFPFRERGCTRLDPVTSQDIISLCHKGEILYQIMAIRQGALESCALFLFVLATKLLQAFYGRAHSEDEIADGAYVV